MLTQRSEASPPAQILPRGVFSQPVYLVAAQSVFQLVEYLKLPPVKTGYATIGCDPYKPALIL